MLSPLPPGAAPVHMVSLGNPAVSAFLERIIGSAIVLFEACSAFTRVTPRTLALSPIRDMLSEGFSYFVTSMAAPQRFLDLAEGNRRTRGLVAEGPLWHFEAEAEPPRATTIEGLEQWVAPGQVQQFSRRH